jgi:hypothetical protein
MTDNGFGTRPTRDWRPWALVAAVGVGVIAIAFAGQVLRPAPAQAGVSFPSVPAQACWPPASADKGGQTLAFDWQLAVEADRPQGSCRRAAIDLP